VLHVVHIILDHLQGNHHHVSGLVQRFQVEALETPAGLHPRVQGLIWYDGEKYTGAHELAEERERESIGGGSKDRGIEKKTAQLMLCM